MAEYYKQRTTDSMGGLLCQLLGNCNPLSRVYEDKMKGHQKLASDAQAALPEAKAALEAADVDLAQKSKALEDALFVGTPMAFINDFNAAVRKLAELRAALAASIAALEKALKDEGESVSGLYGCINSIP